MLKRACFLIFLGCLCIPAISQDQNAIDSLIAEMSLRDGLNEYMILHQLAIEYVDVDNERALEFIEQAETIAYGYRDTLKIMKSQQLKGQILFRLGRPQEVIAIAKILGEKINFREYGREYLSLLNLIGISHLVMSKFDKALAFHLRTYSEAKEMGNQEYIAISMDNIGVVHYKLKDYEKALPFMLNALELRKSLDIEDFASSVNISLCYSNLGQFTKALEYIEQSVIACGDACPPLAEIHIKYALGYMYFGKRQYAKAETAFLKSLTASKRMHDIRMELDNLSMLARLSIENRQFKDAEKFLNQGEAIILSGGVPFNLEMIKIFDQLSELYLQLEKLEKVVFFQRRYITLRDSIYNESLASNLMEIQSDYIERESKTKMAEKDDVISLKEATIGQQQKLNIVVSTLVVIVLALLIYVFRNYQQKRSSNFLLERRIRERTKELESNRDSLLKAISERNVQIGRTSNQVLQAAATIQGLCLNARREIHDATARLYLEKIEATIQQLAKRNSTLSQ